MNIVDALVVTLGLDATNFKAGQAQTTTSLKAIGEGATKTGQDIAKVAQTMTQGFARVRTELLGLLGLFVAGKSIGGLTSEITHQDAALGRLSNRLGVSTNDLSAWEGAAQRAGARSGDATNDLTSMSAALEKFKLTGQGGDTFIPYLTRLGVHLRNANGEMKDTNEQQLEYARAFQEMDKRDPKATDFLAGQLPGMNQGMIDFLRRGPAYVQNSLGRQQQMGTPSRQDAENAQAILGQIDDMGHRVTTFARHLLNDATPSITGLLTKLGAWLDTKLPGWEAAIDRNIKPVADWFANYDWAGLLTKAEAFGTRAMEAFDRLTSWQPPAWLARLLGIGVSPSGTGNDTSTAGDATGSEGVGSKVRRGMGLGTAAAGQKAIDYFVSQGWTPQQAAGIAGNLQQESSFDPQSGVKEQSSHRGIAQWDASRRAGIEKQFGVSVDRMSYDQQLAAVQWELTHGEHRAAGDRLRQETTAGGSAVSVAHNFEIPVAGNDPDAAAKWAKEEAWRRQYAEQHFKAYPGAGQRNLDSNRLLADARPEVNRYGGLWDRPYPQAPRLSVQTGGITVPPLPDEHGFFKDTPTTLDRLRVALARPAARPEPVVAPELAPPAAIRPAAYAVPTAAQRWGSATVHHTEHHDNRSEMHVGPVTVHTQAKDAHGIARDMDAALRARNMAAQANRGLR